MGIVLDPTKCFLAHPKEEILEDYVLCRLPEELTSLVEEHLLICPRCQDAVAETDGVISALKLAARLPDLPNQADVAPDPAPAIGRVGAGWWTLPRFGIRLASLVPVVAVAILALVVIWKRPPEPGAPVTVSLSSLRGQDPLAPAPAGKPLELRIEAPDLTLGKQYRAEVVDAAGGQVWNGTVTETDGKLVAHMPKHLVNGVYWVRLYGPDSRLLREFGLSVK